jgi:hypothetical protein
MPLAGFWSAALPELRGLLRIALSPVEARVVTVHDQGLLKFF